MQRSPPPFLPDPEQMALWPEVSGNAINGLGETAPRRPRTVYWAQDPATIPHGDVQLWFYRQNTDPEMAEERARRVAAAQEPLAPLRPAADPADAAGLTAALRAEAARLGADAVGIATIRPEWLFEGRETPWRRIVLLGIAMEHAELAMAPDLPAAREVMRQYTRGVRMARRLAGWLRGQGQDAAPEPGPMTGTVALVPAALAAGMGELGKHGSIINRDLGACFRLAAVLTDAPLLDDAPDDFGADDFCARCQICAAACPPQAIAPDKQMVRGTAKWYVDFDRCLPYFNETAGCGICLAVCPFSHPDRGPSLVAKLERRRDRLAAAGGR